MCELKKLLLFKCIKTYKTNLDCLKWPSPLGFEKKLYFVG